MTLAETQIECDLALQELQKLFKPYCKLTLIMRNPEAKDGDLILTRDDLEKVELAVRRFKERSRK